MEKDEHNLGDSFVGNWVEDGSSFLFFGRTAEKRVGQLLQARPELELIGTHYFTYEQWQGWSLEPFRVADFIITPPWDREVKCEEGIRIALDPGVVFGDGLHPTTRDCLKALSYIRKLGPFKRVLDLGTGTGILALAAGVLGAESVLAVDINPLCVRTAARNIELNKLQKIIRAVEGRAEGFVEDPAEVVIANMHYEALKGLLESRGFTYTQTFIISGLMRSQFRDIKTRLKNVHFKILREWDHEMTWFTLLAIKSSV